MREKRIVLVNDVTGLSRCSVACQLPIISSMGIETAFVPTAILSINTYHKDFFFDDYTSKMKDYIETYKKMNIDFDGICSGFLGSAKQIEIVKEFFKDFKTDKNFRKTQQLFKNNRVAMCFNGTQVEGTAVNKGLVVDEPGRVFEKKYKEYLWQSYNAYSHVESEILIEVTPEFVEIWDENENRHAFQLFIDFKKKTVEYKPYD